MAKKYVSIARYLAIFLVIAMIPVAVTTYLSVLQAQKIERQAERQNQVSAENEFVALLSKIEKRARNIAENLSTWDETILNFTDATYYQYWKESRVHNAGILDYAIDSVELYRTNGYSLVEPSSIVDKVIFEAVNKAVFLLKDGDPFLVYFHPIYFQTSPVEGESLDGYLAVSVNLANAVAAHDELSRSDHRAIQWKIGDNEIVAMEDILTKVSLRPRKSPEIEAFSELVLQSFSKYFIYSILLLATISVLLITMLGRPLQRMADHIRKMHHGLAGEIPDNIPKRFKIAELEQVRQAVNEYRSKFHSAKDSLIEKNLELEQLTYRDVLTGVFNRRAFESHLTQALESARDEGMTHALCYMDLDQFKVVNDTCGHIAGDELLRQISARLQLSLREADILARLGGDEFGVLLCGCAMQKAEEIAENLRQAIKSLRFVWENKVFDIGVSIGLVAVTDESSCLADILKAADAACYMAKDLGRNRTHVYQHDDEDLAQRYGEMQWVSKITQALDENRFTLYCQPIIPLVEGEYTFSYELLIRMLDDKGKPVPPMAFLPAAERYNLVGNIDKWVVNAACEMVRRYSQVFEKRTPLISINLSGQSLGDADFLEFVLGRLAQVDVNPRLFCFEITETAAITHLVSAKRFIDVLRGKGCRFALDDFGSGLSSFAYLKNLQVDCLKIDGHFVKNMVDDPVDHAMVASINNVGHLMGMRTVAEFVESKEIFMALREIGVDFAQGYCIAKPMPFKTLLEQASNSNLILGRCAVDTKHSA